nr:uncharacterized protein LOC121114675 [Lepeophtheirus salmonis]
MADSSDVLNRLDSLVANTNTTGVGGGGSYSGILKSSKGPSKNKHIRFPDEIQVVIGYGGLYEEDDEDEGREEEEDEEDNRRGNGRRGRSSSDHSDDEVDKEFLSLTRKNTNFNSHLQNLNGEAKPTALLGSTKTKNPPLITVRPFSHRETTSTILTINKVAPMINGQLVKKNLGSDGDEEETDSEDPQEEEDEEVLKPKVSSARLSFLNGTISFETNTSPIPPNIVSAPPAIKEEKKVDTPSPARFISTSVIKNVHIKTSISRKPPILKEKPTVKITSRALLERIKSSGDDDDDDDEEDIDDDVISSSSSDVCSYDVNKKDDETEEHSDEIDDKDEDDEDEEDKPVAAPRKLSVHSMIPFHTPQISISSESKIHLRESENKVQSSIKLLSYTENISNSFNNGSGSISKAPPPIKLPLEAKSSFELNRASIASALEFNRIDNKSVRTSTKRKAPLAPSTEEIPIDIGEKSGESEKEAVEEDSKPIGGVKPVVHLLPGVVPKPPPLPPVNLFKNISLAITKSNTMTSAISKRVNIIEAINKECRNSPDSNYIESSFTAGKPIKMVPPPEPIAFLVKDEDEVRKWKEKKQPYPPSPEISGEILGSSKKSQQNFLSAAANMVINKAEQQLGAAIDESVKLKKFSEKKFSFKKFFHGSSASLKKFNGDSDSSSTSSSSEKSCLDKEHEREILERENKLQGKGGVGGGILRKIRPEIIHPCTFSIDDDAAPATKIEVVKIIPGEGTSRSVSKQPITRSVSSDPQLCLKDHSLSLHKNNTETASISSSSTIDTEYSNKSEITISSASVSFGSETESNNATPSTDFASSSPLSTTSSNCKGKEKPAPPPRRHSLENFVEPNPLRSSRLGLDKVQEEIVNMNEPLKRSDEDFRNSLLIIPQDESENSTPSYFEKNYKAMIEMNNEALRILYEKFSKTTPEPELVFKLNESHLRLSDFDVSKSSRLTTKIGSFYEASWDGIQLTLLLSHFTDLSLKNRIPSLPAPLTSFKEDDVPNYFTIFPSNSDKPVEVYIYSPLKLESLESFFSYIDNSNCSESAKKFFILQLLSALEQHPRETDTLCYFMCRKLHESGLFSYKLISVFVEPHPEEPSYSSFSLYHLLHSILNHFDVPEGSPPSLLGKRKREIEQTLFAEGSALHLQKAEALTKLVSKSTPSLSVVEEYQLKYLLSQETDIIGDREYRKSCNSISSAIAIAGGTCHSSNNEITYVYNV